MQRYGIAERGRAPISKGEVRKSREAISEAEARKSGEMIRVVMELHRFAADQDCLGLPRMALELIGRKKHGQGVVKNCPAPERNWTEPEAVRRNGVERPRIGIA